MNDQSCAACGKEIPNGEALIRSRSLVQVAFHRSCYRPAPAIPLQRTGTHDELTAVTTVSPRLRG